MIMGLRPTTPARLTLIRVCSRRSAEIAADELRFAFLQNRIHEALKRPDAAMALLASDDAYRVLSAMGCLWHYRLSSSRCMDLRRGLRRGVDAGVQQEAAAFTFDVERIRAGSRAGFDDKEPGLATEPLLAPPS